MNEPAPVGTARLIVIARFRDTGAAQMARSYLADAGIECRLEDQIITDMLQLDVESTTYRLSVREPDVAEAVELLQDSPARDYLHITRPLRTPGETGQTCPACSSADTRYTVRPRWLEWAVHLMPLLPVGKAWECNTCGTRFQEE